MKTYNQLKQIERDYGNEAAEKALAKLIKRKQWTIAIVLMIFYIGYWFLIFPYDKLKPTKTPTKTHLTWTIFHVEGVNIKVDSVTVATFYKNTIHVYDTAYFKNVR